MKKAAFISVLLFAVLNLFAADQPWCVETFPPMLVNADGQKVSVDTLRGKNILLYFSASWCGPCRGFTPQLVQFYHQTAKRNNFEIIFVTSDRSEDAMMNYMKKDKMPWLAIPFGSPQIAVLKSEFQVSGIPKLIVLNSRGDVISTSARMEVVRLQEKAVVEWKKVRVPLSSASSRKTNAGYR